MRQARNNGGGVDLLGSRVTLTHDNHSSSYEGTYPGESCGFVVEAPDLPTIYFAGDTNVFGDMALIRRIYAPEIAVLPIGDHFTMGPREAAVAAELIRAKRVLPSHYGTFPLLTGTPETMRDMLPADVELVAPAPGETVGLWTHPSRGTGRPGARFRPISAASIGIVPLPQNGSSNMRLGFQ